MRVLVTGSVSWADPAPVEEALDEFLTQDPDMVVITGMAEGVDEVARRWARRNNVEMFAEPLEPGEYPGPMHHYNERMLSWEPDIVVACKPNLDLTRNPDAGTEHMCRIAEAAGVLVQRLQVGDQRS